MHAPITLVLLTAAASFGAAAPLEERICGKVLLPSTQRQLKQSAPDTTFANTATTDQSVQISQGVNSAGQVINKVNELIAFTGPAAGSYGCSLGITFPSNYVFPSNTGASPTLNVYTVPVPLPSSPTYNNIHPNTGLFGTVTVQAGQSVVINSEACPTTAQGGLGFVFSYSDWVNKAGTIAWNGSKAGQDIRGVFLSYNC